MPNLIQTLEHDVVVVWDDFQKGVHWLEAEAAAVGKWLQHVDPAIGAQFQTLIADGEKAAAGLAQYGGQALGVLISGAIPEVETVVASLVANAVGSTPAALVASKGSAQVVADIGEIAQAVSKVALAKVLGGIASAASAAGAPNPPAA